MKRILALMLAAAALLCFAGCMSRFPIGKRGNVTLRFYTEPIPESMVPVNDGSLIGSTMNLTVSDSATVRRYVNSIRKWTDDTAVDREEYVFIGEISVENNLGVCYENGQGVPKDLQKAIELYRKSAEQGNEIAINNLKRLGKWPK